MVSVNSSLASKSNKFSVDDLNGTITSNLFDPRFALNKFKKVNFCIQKKSKELL